MPRGRPFAKGNPGKAPGTQTRVGYAVKQALAAALAEAGGKAYFVKLAEDHPQAFATLVGKLIPNEVVGEIGGKFEIVWKDPAE